MMKKVLLAVGMLAVTGMFFGATAQNARLHTEVLGVGSVLTGGDFDGLDAGYGGQLFVGPKIGDVSILASGSFRRYGVQNLDDHANVYAVGLAPRYTVPLENEVVQPWVGVNGGVLFQDVNMAGPAPDETSTGFEVGGSAGIGFQLAERVILNTCANLGYMRFGDVSVNDVSINNTGTNGMGFTFGLGLTIVP